MYDENFVVVKSCNVDKGFFTLYVNLLQPLTNCHLQLEFFSVPKGPFKFNATWDACEFMKRRKRYRSLGLFYDLIAKNSNINHSCPYDVSIFFTEFLS